MQTHPHTHPTWSIGNVCSLSLSLFLFLSFCMKRLCVTQERCTHSSFAMCEREKGNRERERERDAFIRLNGVLRVDRPFEVFESVVVVQNVPHLHLFKWMQRPRIFECEHSGKKFKVIKTYFGLWKRVYLRQEMGGYLLPIFKTFNVYFRYTFCLKLLRLFIKHLIMLIIESSQVYWKY